MELMTDAVSHLNEGLPSEFSAEYSLSVEEASALCFEAGVPRSPRTLMRYCAHGHLDCRKIDTERNEKYLISRGSLERRIQELLQVATTGHVETHRDTTRHNAPSRDTSRTDEQSGELEEKMKQLEAENFDLKVTNKAKDQLIQMVREERVGFIEQLTAATRRMGQLEERLQLMAPRNDTGAGPARPEPAASAATLTYPQAAASDESPPVIE